MQKTYTNSTGDYQRLAIGTENADKTVNVRLRLAVKPGEEKTIELLDGEIAIHSEGLTEVGAPSIAPVPGQPAEGGVPDPSLLGQPANADAPVLADRSVMLERLANDFELDYIDAKAHVRHFFAEVFGHNAVAPYTLPAVPPPATEPPALRALNVIDGWTLPVLVSFAEDNRKSAPTEGRHCRNCLHAEPGHLGGCAAAMAAAGQLALEAAFAPAPVVAPAAPGAATPPVPSPAVSAPSSASSAPAETSDSASGGSTSSGSASGLAGAAAGIDVVTEQPEPTVPGTLTDPLAPQQPSNAPEAPTPPSAD